MAPLGVWWGVLWYGLLLSSDDVFMLVSFCVDLTLNILLNHWIHSWCLSNSLWILDPRSGDFKKPWSLTITALQIRKIGRVRESEPYIGLSQSSGLGGVGMFDFTIFIRLTNFLMRKLMRQLSIRDHRCWNISNHVVISCEYCIIGHIRKIRILLKTT